MNRDIFQIKIPEIALVSEFTFHGLFFATYAI
jgi:hypothetical protein